MARTKKTPKFHPPNDKMKHDTVVIDSPEAQKNTSPPISSDSSSSVVSSSESSEFSSSASSASTHNQPKKRKVKYKSKVNTKRKASGSNHRNRKRECTSDMKRSARSYSEDDKSLSHRKKAKDKRKKMKCSRRLSTKEAKTPKKDLSVDSNALKDFNEFQEYCTISKEDGVNAVSSFLQYKEYNKLKTIAMNKPKSTVSSVVPASAPHPVYSRRFHRPGSNQPASAPQPVDY